MKQVKKAKRIKRVFTSADQVIHLWANQSQSDARCKNAYFEGNRIFSYGPHYLLGELIKHKGKTVALINNYRYSMTTNKHINSAIHACSHLPTVSTSRDDWSVKAGLKLKQKQLLDQLDKHFRQRMFGSWIKSWRSVYSDRISIDAFNKLCDELKEKKFKIKITKDFIKKYDSHIKKRKKLNAELSKPEAILERQLKREKLAQAKTAKEIKQWREGGSLTNSLRNLPTQILRIKDDKIQTSRGAEVDLLEGKKFLVALKSNKIKSGAKVGDFVFDKVSDGNVKISCHTIAISEIEKVLGLSNFKLVVNN